MTPVLKTIDSDIKTEMFANVLKVTNGVKIHSWKIKAEKLKANERIKYEILKAILESYENKNDQAIATSNKTLLLTSNISIQASIYRNIGNMYTHVGDFLSAIDSYLQAYKLTLAPSYYDAALSIAKLYFVKDERLNDMKSFDHNKKIEIQESLLNLDRDLKEINLAGLNLEIYRDILNSAFTVFFKHCCDKLQRFLDISDSNLSTILFNPKLDLKTVELLNDEMNQELINLLDKYDYEDLLKYPILFSSENFELK